MKLNDKFSSTSKKRLLTCHIDAQIIMNCVVESYDCTILEGHRVEEKQNEYFEEGKSRVRWPKGKHNSTPSMAWDTAPYFLTLPHIRWNDRDGFYMFAGWIQGTAKVLYNEGKISHLVRSGCDWDGDRDTKDQTFMDLVHFELYRPLKSSLSSHIQSHNS